MFQHGIAVAPVADRLESPVIGLPGGSLEGPAEADRGVESRLKRLDDGTSVWEPRAQDGQALGQVLNAAAGSSLAAVQWEEPVEPGEAGLALRVQGSSLLLLPGEYGDVQVEVELEVDRFEGTVGLAHHVQSASDAGLFLISVPSGGSRLVALVEGVEESMAEAEAALDSGILHLAVFAAGRHSRGMQDGEVVVHGHRAPLESGGCGIFLSGNGVVRILSLRVIPIVE